MKKEETKEELERQAFNLGVQAKAAQKKLQDKIDADLMKRTEGLTRDELYRLIDIVKHYLSSTPGDCDDE